jgi:iron complex outermembrane receptor protein
MGSRFRRVDTAGRARAVGAALLLTFPVSLPLTALATDPDPPVRKVGPVTVTATRSEREVLEVAGNVTVIDREEIERIGAPNLPELLRRQPGLFVTNTTTNPAGYTIDARGFNNGGGNGTNMLVLVDGRRVNEPDSDFADWALLPLDEIENIEIVRGPVSALYGDNAVGGVVNIRTRPAEGPPRVTLRGRGASWQTGGGSLSAAGTVGSFTGAVFADGLYSHGYRNQSAFAGQTYRGSLEWSPSDRVRLGGRLGYHNDEREFPGAVTQADIDLNGRRDRAPDNGGDQGEVDAGFAAGWLDAFLADDIRLSLEPNYRARSDQAEFTSIAFGSTQVDSDKGSTGVNAQIQIDRALFGFANRLLIGGEFLHDDRDSSSNSADLFGQCSAPRTTTHTDSSRNLYAGFVQDELQLDEQWLLAGGVRFDHAELDVRAHNDDPLCGGAESNRPDYAVWSPRASLTFRPRDGLAFYASYARGFRSPSLDEASPLVFPGFVSLPDLDEQTSNAGEGGVKLDTDRIDAGFALYYMMVNDEILFDPVFFTNQNLEQVRHFGIETSIDVEIVSWLGAYATYTYENVRINEADTPELDGASMPITPEHRGTAGVVASLPWWFEARAHAHFVGERILANDFGQAGGKLDPLPWYATLDLLLAWRPELSEHVSGALSFGLRNVNDEEFDDVGVRVGSTPYFYPAPTRSWEVGVSITVRQ